MGLMKNFLNSSAFALACLLFAGTAQAFTPYVVREIRAEGLVRLELGTLLTYLPLSEGDEINTVSARQAIRSLYATGLFEDVQLDKDGDALVIRVTERPAIVRFEIEGNSKVGGDELDKSLKELGLAEGELFRRELLDQVQQELERQYFANGYYDVQIDTTLDFQANNRVAIKVDVIEGSQARIRGINLLGNEAFTRPRLPRLRLPAPRRAPRPVRPQGHARSSVPVLGPLLAPATRWRSRNPAIVLSGSWVSDRRDQLGAGRADARSRCDLHHRERRRRRDLHRQGHPFQR